MDTQTAPAPTAPLDAAERAQKVQAAIFDGYDTNTSLIKKTGIPKTTLRTTIEYLLREGRITKLSVDGSVFYRMADTSPAPRDKEPDPEGMLTGATGLDTLAGPPDPRIAAAIAAKAAKLTPPPAAAPDSGTAAPVRLPKGQAKELLLAFLAQHDSPDGYGPYELGRAIAPAGHKPMGVRDLCAKLAKDGVLTIIQDKPVRYRLAGQPVPAE